VPEPMTEVVRGAKEEGSEAREGELRILATVTLGPNQLRAHLEPILKLPEVDRITLVSDKPGPTMPKFRTVIPRGVLMRVLGRAGAKLVTCVLVARREKPDWIVSYNLVPHTINARLVGLLLRRPVMCHIIGGPIEWQGGGWKSDNRILGRLPRPVRLLEAFLVRVIRGCEVIVVMGPQSRTALVERGVPPERVVIVPGGVDSHRFRRSNGASPLYQLVTAGRLIPTKQTLHFVEAFARLRARRPQLRAAVLGDGPLADAVRAEAGRLGVGDAIEFLGFRHDIENVYAQSEIFVLTSRNEGLSLAMLEAMACGLTVVVSDVGEARVVVQDERSGYLFPVGDLDALVERLEQLLDDPSLRARLGRAAEKEALRVAEYSRIADAYRKILVERTTPPAEGSVY
jgi:glycosyltransferase involved in cell wall biosynthesis